MLISIKTRYLNKQDLPTGPSSLSLYESLMSTLIVSSAVEGRARMGFLRVSGEEDMADFLM